MAQEKEYEVEVFVDGMENSELGTLTIVATTPKKAIKWVKDNMRFSVVEAD